MTIPIWIMVESILVLPAEAMAAMAMVPYPDRRRLLKLEEKPDRMVVTAFGSPIANMEKLQ